MTNRDWFKLGLVVGCIHVLFRHSGTVGCLLLMPFLFLALVVLLYWDVIFPVTGFVSLGIVIWLFARRRGS